MKKKDRDYKEALTQALNSRHDILISDAQENAYIEGFQICWRTSPDARMASDLIPLPPRFKGAVHEEAYIRVFRMGYDDCRDYLNNL
jgi:hypothetical protein